MDPSPEQPANSTDQALSVGQRLQRARLEAGLSLEDIHQRTHIRPDVLRALEADDHSALSGAVYARAFVRDYAAALKLNEDELVAQLPREQPPVQPVRHGMSFSGFIPWIIMALFALVLGVSLVVIGGRDRDTATRPAPGTYDVVQPPEPHSRQAATDTPGQSTRATDAAVVRLSLHAVESSWVRVQADGQTLFEGTLAPGTERQFASPQGLSLRLGNAGGVRVRLNDEDEQLLGARGEVVSRTFKPGETQPEAGSSQSSS